MHRFYLPPDQSSGDRLLLSGREAHHALHVLRLRREDQVSVLDGSGTVLDCTVSETGRDSVILVVGQRQLTPPHRAKVSLYQALPKGKTFETIIQKATELCAARIVPILSEHVIAQIGPDEIIHKAEKWQLCAIEAIKQSGAPWLPEVAAPIALKKLLEKGVQTELSLVGSLHGNTRHPHACFREFAVRRGRKPESVSVWIGPEGDFTRQEIDLILTAGALPITLGPVILRADTAAISCLSVINHELTSPEAP